MLETEGVRLIRHLINDLASPYKYDDDRLIELLIVSAQFVNQEVSFETEYTIDLDELTLCPDPTERSTRNDSFINLMVLKACCILDQSNARQAAKTGMSVRDSIGIAIDTRGQVGAYLKLLEIGYCQAYTNAKLEYELDRSSTAGRAILSPFKTDVMIDSDVDFR